jgi:hypothetical protein
LRVVAIDSREDMARELDVQGDETIMGENLIV